VTTGQGVSDIGLLIIPTLAGLDPGVWLIAVQADNAVIRFGIMDS
jgi:hypothetical protein